MHHGFWCNICADYRDEDPTSSASNISMTKRIVRSGIRLWTKRLSFVRVHFANVTFRLSWRSRPNPDDCVIVARRALAPRNSARATKSQASAVQIRNNDGTWMVRPYPSARRSFFLTNRHVTGTVRQFYRASHISWHFNLRSDTKWRGKFMLHCWY